MTRLADEKEKRKMIPESRRKARAEEERVEK
jgi:hypothetical protein